MDEWRSMAEHMGGVDVMGGPATGLLIMTKPTDSAPTRKPVLPEPGDQRDSLPHQQH